MYKDILFEQVFDKNGKSKNFIIEALIKKQERLSFDKENIRSECLLVILKSFENFKFQGIQCQDEIWKQLSENNNFFKRTDKMLLEIYKKQLFCYISKRLRKVRENHQEIPCLVSQNFDGFTPTRHTSNII